MKLFKNITKAPAPKKSEEEVNKIWEVKMLLAEQSQHVANMAQIASLPSFDVKDINNFHKKYQETQRKILDLLR